MPRSYLGYTPDGAKVFRNIRRSASNRPLLLLEQSAKTQLQLDLTDYLETGETISSVTVTSSGPTVTSSNTTTKVTLTISGPTTWGDVQVIITLSSGNKLDETILVRIPARVGELGELDYRPM